MKKNDKSLATKIFIGLILGIILGLIATKSPMIDHIVENYLAPIGTMYLNLLKLVVVPIVLLSIICGVMSMKDMRRVWSVGWKTLLFFLVTTCIAIIIGLVGAIFSKNFFPLLDITKLEYTPATAKPFMQVLVDIFPSNIIAPLSSANMLQVIVIAIVVGFGVILAGSKAKDFEKVLISANEVFIKVMDMIIFLSPYGVFCLIAPVVAVNGPKVLQGLLAVIIVAYVCYAIHAVAVYSMLVSSISKITPGKFFSYMSSAMVMAFSSASSVGTLPLTLECTERLGAKRDIASFVLPLGATVNMDGTAIYHGVCTVFIAACFGITLTPAQICVVVVTATLSSIGTAGVPGAGVVMLAMVLQAVNIPVEGIALVIGVDRIFDMGRTVLNITGDAACALCVSSVENTKNKITKKKNKKN